MKNSFLLLIGLIAMTAFGQNPVIVPTGNIGIIPQYKTGGIFDSILKTPVRTLEPYATNADSIGRLLTRAADSALYHHNGEEYTRLATKNEVDASILNAGQFNTSFVEVLAKDAAIKNSYFRKVNNATDTYRFGVLVNGEAVEYTFKINQDDFMLLSNVYSNTLSGNFMNDTGRKRLSSGVLEYAIRVREAGTALDYEWIPSHSASVGATVTITREVYIDGVLTDIAALANGTDYICEEIKIVQRYTGYNLDDTGTPLFDCTTTHFFKDGKLTFTNSLVALEDVQVESGYANKITGYTPIFTNAKSDTEIPFTLAGTENHYLYTTPCQSIVFYSDTYAGAITVGKVAESTSYGRVYAPTETVHFWDRDGNASCYWPFTTYQGYVTIPVGSVLESQATLMFVANTKKIIR